MVGIKEVVRCFGGVDIALFIGAYGVFGYETDIGLVKPAMPLGSVKTASRLIR
jgi:hypothetical protein